MTYRWFKGTVKPTNTTRRERKDKRKTTTRCVIEWVKAYFSGLFME